TPSSNKQFLFDLVAEVFIPEVKEAIKAGARYITSDEPAYTTIPADRESYIEAYKRLFKGIRHELKEYNCKFGFHTCFSHRYDILFEDLPQLPWDYGSLEYANRDKKSLGTSHNDRFSYHDGLERTMQAFNEGSRCKLALGILEVHADRHFSEEEVKSGNAKQQLQKLVRDRLLYQARYLERKLGEVGPFLLLAAPDCGLRPVRKLNDLHMMLSAMVEGTHEARSILQKELGLPAFQST
ncbi:MAG: hypothetical protein ACW991_08145, partial [Candidatus Hodarchaeales archaeon]